MSTFSDRRARLKAARNKPPQETKPLLRPVVTPMDAVANAINSLAYVSWGAMQAFHLRMWDIRRQAMLRLTQISDEAKQAKGQSDEPDS